MSILRLWLGIAFSPKGRVDRRQFWLISLATLLVSFATSALFDTVDPTKHFGIPMSVFVPVDLLVIVAALAGIYVSLAVAIKRLHDRNRGGAWYLVGLIPILGWIWLMVELGFRRGDAGINRFGTPPARQLDVVDL